MSIMLIILASIGAYLGIGAVWARRDMPHLWAQARAEWHIESIARETVMVHTAITVLLWPIAGPIRLLIRLLRDAVEQGDPKAKERALKLREREVARLERELGIGRRP